MATAMEEVVVRLIIDQPAWLLYPDPILPDVQSLTHHTPSWAAEAQYCTVSRSNRGGQPAADKRAFHPVLCPPRSSDPKTEGFLHMGLAVFTTTPCQGH